jgi:hypothetical protein
VGHVAAPELPSQEGRARSHRTCGSTGAHLFKEVRIEAEGHVTVAELTSVRRRGPGRETRGGVGAHLCLPDGGLKLQLM